jgi:superfamily I DNA/RNA helicase
MAIGDDWQSIYGWRGSAPQLFIDFSDYFTSHAALGPGDPMLLTRNYRSAAAVVEDASRLLSRVVSKVTKPSYAEGVAHDGDHGVRLIAYAPQAKHVDDVAAAPALCKFIKAQYVAACKMASAKDEHVIVMTRRRSLRDLLQERIGDHPGLQICTYHQAKGLEADIAILIQDCAPGPSHPLRNTFYAASGVFDEGYTYDDAGADEAFRLGYVGVTRARRRVFWLVPDIETTVGARIYSELVANGSRHGLRGGRAGCFADVPPEVADIATGA